MIETTTVNNVHCDVCGEHIGNADPHAYVFLKDICANCLEVIIKKIESDRILSRTRFDAIVDDIKPEIQRR